jgi:hypothetical protein
LNLLFARGYLRFGVHIRTSMTLVKERPLVEATGAARS